MEGTSSDTRKRIVIYSSDLEDDLQDSPIKVDGGQNAAGRRAAPQLPDDLASVVADSGDPFAGLNPDDSNGAWMHNIDLSNCIRLTQDEHKALVHGHADNPQQNADSTVATGGTQVATTSSSVTSSGTCAAMINASTGRPSVSANTRIAADHSYVPQAAASDRPRPTLQRQSAMFSQPGRLQLKPSAAPPPRSQQPVHAHVIRPHHGREGASTRDYRQVQRDYSYSTLPSTSMTYGGGDYSHLTATPRGKIYKKPVYSYSCLIGLALKNSEHGKLTVAEIYAFMCENFPYFRTAPPGWKNSVRHNLSLNKCFDKIEIETPGGHGRKSCLWSMADTKWDKMDQEIRKWRDKDAEGVRESLLNSDDLEIIERGEKGMPPAAPTYNMPDYDNSRPPFGAASGLSRVASTGRAFCARGNMMHSGGTRSSYSLHNRSGGGSDDWSGGAPAKMARMHRQVSAGAAAISPHYGGDECAAAAEERQALARAIALGGPASVQHRLQLGTVAAEARGRMTPPRMGAAMPQMCGNSPGVYPAGSPCYEQHYVGFPLSSATPPYSPSAGGMHSPMKQSPASGCGMPPSMMMHGTPTHAMPHGHGAVQYQYSPFALQKLTPINFQWSPYDEAKHGGQQRDAGVYQQRVNDAGLGYGLAPDAGALSPDFKMVRTAAAYDTAQSAIHNNSLLQSALAFSPYRPQAPPPVPPHAPRPAHTSLLQSM